MAAFRARSIAAATATTVVFLSTCGLAVPAVASPTSVSTPLVATAPLPSPIPLSESFAGLLTSDSEQRGLSVAITDISHGVITDSTTELIIRGTLTNLADHVIDSPTVTTSATSTLLRRPEQLWAFMKKEFPVSKTVDSQVLATQLSPGHSAEFSIVVDKAALAQQGAQFGAQGIAIRVSSGADSGSDRSLVVWNTSPVGAPGQIHVMVPWTEATPTPDLSTISEIRGLNGVTLGVDPTVIPNRDNDLSEVEETQWLSFATDTRPIVAIPPHDPDLNLVAHDDVAWAHVTRAPDLLAGALRTFVNNPAGGSTPIPEVVTLPWAPTPATLPVLKRLADKDFIASTGDFPGIADKDRLLAPRIELSTSTGAIASDENITAGSSVNTLSSHNGVSHLLTIQGETPEDKWDHSQLITAVSTVLADPIRGVPSSLLVTLPRGTAITPELSTNIQRLLNASWILPASVDDLLASPTSTIARTIPHSDDLDAELTALLDELSRLQKRANPLLGTLTSGDEPERQWTRSYLQVLNHTATPEARITALAALKDATRTMTSSIGVETSENVTVITKDVTYPVSVRNDLPWDVDVVVTIKPRDQRLYVQEPVKVTIPAHSRIAAQVPVTVLGSGTLHVTYVVTTMDGTILDNSASAIVNLHAAWEDIFTAGAGVAVGILFIAGVYRSIRRKRGPQDVITTPNITAHSDNQPKGVHRV